MKIHLSIEEKQFLDEVLKELKAYDISSTERKQIKQQIVEHIQEAREHGYDSVDELGDITTFVKDFLEVKGIDLHSKMKQMRNSKNRRGTLFVISLSTLIGTYLISQLLLSMFLTQSFNPLNTNKSFQYNVFYQISDHSWWNVLLISMSVIISMLASGLVVFFTRRRII